MGAQEYKLVHWKYFSKWEHKDMKELITKPKPSYFISRDIAFFNIATISWAM